jgi:cytochrome c oxidase subunit III
MASASPVLHAKRAGVSNGVLGMAFFIASEAMFFAGLISGFLVLRAEAGVWPPPDQPRLPLLVTAFNTLLLLASAGGMRRAMIGLTSHGGAGVDSALRVTATLGSAFLVLQGWEWLRLVRFGLTTVSSLYGATFYVLVGAHALHVLAALVALWLVRARLRPVVVGVAPDASRLRPMALYWYFVVAVWPVLYVLVYLL